MSPTSTVYAERDDPWTLLVDKIAQTAFLLVASKLLAAWAVIALRGVELSARFLWGFLPYAGLRTSGAELRTVAAWSTATSAVVAALWVLAHFVRRHRHPAVWSWGAAGALPMAAALTFFEWWRRFDADHLIPTSWLVRILIFLAVATTLFLGFIEMPEKRDRAGSTDRSTGRFPEISAQP